MSGRLPDEHPWTCLRNRSSIWNPFFIRSQGEVGNLTFCECNATYTPAARKLTWQWEIPIINREYIFKRSIFSILVYSSANTLLSWLLPLEVWLHDSWSEVTIWGMEILTVEIIQPSHEPTFLAPISGSFLEGKWDPLFQLRRLVKWYCTESKLSCVMHLWFFGCVFLAARNEGRWRKPIWFVFRGWV